MNFFFEGFRSTLKHLSVGDCVFFEISCEKLRNESNFFLLLCFFLWVSLKQSDFLWVLLCFIDPRVRKIRNEPEASGCPGIFSSTRRFYYVASSLSSPLPHLLDRHKKLVGCSAIPDRSCPGPVWYPWGSIRELEVPPDETPRLMTLHPHNTNVLQSITPYAKSPNPPERSNPGQKNQCFRHEYG